MDDEKLLHSHAVVNSDLIGSEQPAALAEIDDLKAQINARDRSADETERLRRELTIEAIYHTNRIEGNSLTLTEVRAEVEAFRAEDQGQHVQPAA